ncbi:MAG: MoxR family ATPase [Candidatus Bathyarchaeia archaeon]
MQLFERIFKQKNSKELEESLLVIKKHLTTEVELERLQIVLKGQYKEAYETLDNAINAGLTPALVGPPGVGKSFLARRYAQDTGRPFYEIFFDETMKPSSLIGYFDPAITMKKGYCLEAFIPGPLSKAMVEGGIFLAQELNRATEYCQNTLLAPLEERRYYIPRLGHIKADKNFVLIAAMNPAELGGTYRLSEALKDRIGVWIPLGYPSKEVEIEIIKVNSPEYRIEEYVFEIIYSIINKARKDKRFDSPSIRDGIAIARMLGEIKNKKGRITNEDIVICASYVLRINMKDELGSEYAMKEFIEEFIR